MSGHRPFRELMEKLPPARQRRIKARAAKLHAQIEAAKAEERQARQSEGEQEARQAQAARSGVAGA